MMADKKRRRELIPGLDASLLESGLQPRIDGVGKGGIRRFNRR
jgi:hypothetical protein